MSHFWRGLFDQFKDCGRNASLFYMTLGGLFGLLIVFGWLFQSPVGDWLLYGLPVAVVAMFAWLIVSIREAVLRSRQRLNIYPLSSDEISKARSKLVRRRE